MAQWGIPWGSPKKRGLRTWVVHALHRGPKNGAELMDDLERMTHGWWRPSPGSIYPLLDDLVREGVARKREDGRYELTIPFRENAGWPFDTSPRSVREVVTEMKGLTSYLEDLKRTDEHTIEAVHEDLAQLLDRLKQVAR